MKKERTRREFLSTAKNLALGLGVVGIAPGMFLLKDARAAIPVSGGYLLVDTKKCQGCVSCMLACSLVNEGEENLSLSRIQILQNSFENWPDDVSMEQCRQCVEPACLEACPTGALHADAAYGNVRRVDSEKCIGCGLCLEACPFTPTRPILAGSGKSDNKKKARKCDLCATAPYHWDEAGGGPQGKQACVEVCPVKRPSSSRPKCRSRKATRDTRSI
ncbi:MAG: 4Fe-4S dicluster domain-containing protein [Deltaproteobacteria bacterium]|nr:4Fe-4S dicluster domain-containing protein [Deltaproteobacteria bacterium]